MDIANFEILAQKDPDEAARVLNLHLVILSYSLREREVVAEKLWTDAYQATAIMARHQNKNFEKNVNTLMSLDRSTPRLPHVHTQGGLECLEACMEHGKGSQARQFLYKLLSVARESYAYSEVITNKAVQVLPAITAITPRNEYFLLPIVAEHVLETAELNRRSFLEQAFRANWQMITTIPKGHEHRSSHIIHYGLRVARENDALESYIKTGREAMDDIVKKNTPMAITAASALEQATDELVLSVKRDEQPGQYFGAREQQKKAFMTPEFAWVGDARKGKQRWFFPTTDGQGQKSVLTLVYGDHGIALPDAETLKPEGKLKITDIREINHVRGVFSDAVKASAADPEAFAAAAQRMGSTLGHFNLDAYK